MFATRAMHMKYIEGWQHEMVVFVLSDRLDDSGSGSYAIVERTNHHGLPFDYALDKFTLYRGQKFQPEESEMILLGTIEFSSYTPSLEQLLILANVVSREAPTYSILGTHCWWYATTIYSRLSHMFEFGSTALSLMGLWVTMGTQFFPEPCLEQVITDMALTPSKSSSAWQLCDQLWNVIAPFFPDVSLKDIVDRITIAPLSKYHSAWSAYDRKICDVCRVSSTVLIDCGSEVHLLPQSTKKSDIPANQFTEQTFGPNARAQETESLLWSLSTAKSCSTSVPVSVPRRWLKEFNQSSMFGTAISDVTYARHDQNGSRYGDEFLLFDVRSVSGHHHHLLITGQNIDPDVSHSSIARADGLSIIRTLPTSPRFHGSLRFIECSPPTLEQVLLVVDAVCTAIRTYCPDPATSRSSSSLFLATIWEVLKLEFMAEEVITPLDTNIKEEVLVEAHQCYRTEYEDWLSTK